DAEAATAGSGLFAGMDVSLDVLGRGEPGAANGATGSLVAALRGQVDQARAALRETGPAAAGAPPAGALPAIRAMRAAVASRVGTQPAASEADQLLARKEAECLEAIALAAGLRLEALASAGVVSPGQEVTVTVYAANRLAPGLELAGIA